MDERYTVLGEYEDADTGRRMRFALRISSWEPYSKVADYNINLWVFRQVGNVPRWINAVLHGWPDLIEDARWPCVVDEIYDIRPRPR